MAKLVGNSLDFNSASRILNLPSPASANEPARLADLNSAVEGLAWKDSVRVATQANINLAGPGATVDGITMTAGDRMLVKSQTAGAENGIYIWNGAAVAATRSPDASTSEELEQAVVTVEEGTSAGATLRQTVVNFVLGTGAPNFTAFGTSSPAASETTAGVAEIATQAETDAGTVDNVFVTPLKMATYASRIKKYTTTIGDGTATSYTVTHNLNTKVVVVTIYATGGTFDEVFADVQHTTVNTLTVVFSTAPASGAYTVVVVG
ncbi:MAG: hypothetical protein M3367_02875 [Acidobacteriota bacterium]|nr:hypothetical protein [Acidobacteriota bacterium]